MGKATEYKIGPLAVTVGPEYEETQRLGKDGDHTYVTVNASNKGHPVDPVGLSHAENLRSAISGKLKQAGFSTREFEHDWRNSHDRVVAVTGSPNAKKMQQVINDAVMAYGNAHFPKATKAGKAVPTSDYGHYR